jgi:hypothetical protein
MGFRWNVPVLFAIPTAGWIAQWEEMLLDPEQKIARPRQVYTGAKTRDYVSRETRMKRLPRNETTKNYMTMLRVLPVFVAISVTRYLMLPYSRLRRCCSSARRS